MLIGSCLCGAVKIKVDGELEHSPEACHCTQCRKQSGHYLAAINAKTNHIDIEGEDNVTWYQSSDKVKRGFCGNCGSTLFWKPVIDGYEYTAICLGTLDSPFDTNLAKHTFVNDKGSYYELSDGVPQSESY